MTRTTLDHLAGWLVDARRRVPEEIVTDRARLAILDAVGVALAARDKQIVQVTRGTPGYRSAKRSTILGCPLAASPADSAFAMGAMAHELDFDDSSADIGGHPTTVVLPAALALAQEYGATWEELVRAYILGVEVMAALGRMLNPDHYDRGWHPTTTLGIFGATAACATLLDADERATVSALSLATAMASGIKASFGTLAKPIQAGRAAANGTTCAVFAASGVEASPAAFDADQGFLRVFEGRGRAGLSLRLPGEDGQGSTFLDPGLIIKRYPCCGSTHSSIDAAEALHARLDATAMIDRCIIRVHPARRGHVDRPRPSGALEAKFSLQYVVAAMLVRGQVVLDDFADDDRLQQDAVLQLMDRTEVQDLAARDDEPQDRFAAEVEVHVGSAVDREHVPLAVGRERGRMLSERDVRSKYDACTRTGPPRKKDIAVLVLGASKTATEQLFVLSAEGASYHA